MIHDFPKCCIVLIGFVLIFSTTTKYVLAQASASESLQVDTLNSNGTAQSVPSPAVVLSLVEFFPVAERGGLPERIEFRHPDEVQYVSLGWEFFETARDSKGAWITSRDAVLDLPLVSPMDLSVEIDLQSLDEDSLLDSPKLIVLWNGVKIGRIYWDWGAVTQRVTIPVEVQRHGPNRMELLPNYWAIPKEWERKHKRSAEAVMVNEVRFVKAKTRLSQVESTVEKHGNAIRLGPNALLTYYFELPQNARFRSKLRLVPQNKGRLDGTAGHIVVVVRPRGGEERILLYQDLAAVRGKDDMSLDLSLEDLGGQFVSIGLHYVAENLDLAEGREGVAPLVEWHNARIEGVGFKQDAHAMPDAKRRDLNVLIVLFDSLRADHTGPYGGRPKTPRMDALAASGVLFENALSNCSWTRPSVASMLTSLYQSVHGVIKDDNALPPSVPYLPAVLQQQGFRTLAIINNAQVDPEFGFGRGFDVVHRWYKDPNRYVKRNTTPKEQVQKVWDCYFEPFLAESSERPFFVYLHENDPHHPYKPPVPFDTLYGNPSQSNIVASSRFIKQVHTGGIRLDRQDAEYLRAKYMGEITFMDGYLGHLRDLLEERGLLDNTLIVFTSDHGEEFLEHGSISHGRTLYEEMLRVPLIMSLPGILKEGVRIRDSMELLDLPPTILALLGLDIPGSMQGQSMLGVLLSGERQRADRPTFARCKTLESVTYKEWKLIVSSAPKSGQREYALYDLSNDAEESVNLWPQELIIGKALKQMLALRHFRDKKLKVSLGNEESTVEDVSPEVEDNLKALGYL